MTLEQEGCWIRLLKLAAEPDNRLGYGKIGVTEIMGYTEDQLASLLGIAGPKWYELVSYFHREGMIITHPNMVLEISNWKHYQGEYLRLADWKQKRKRQKETPKETPKKEEGRIKNKEQEQRNNNKDKDLVPSAPTLITFFVDKYHEKTGEKYFVNGGKDGSLMASLEKRLGRDEVLARLERFFSSRDEFILKAGFSIGVFYSQVNKLTGSSGKFAGLKAWAAKQESHAKG